MTGTTAKAHLYERLMEPLRGCKDLNVYRHNLMKWVMSMPDLEVREHLEYLELNHQASHQPQTPSAVLGLINSHQHGSATVAT